MTLVLETPGHEAKAHTHVLIIGVGRYRHISDGTVSQNFTQPPLGQLKSPPVSARALADWFASEHNNPAAPLGTVELLLSDAGGQQYAPPGSSTVFDIEDATMSHIESAFNAWDARCHTHPNNVAFFYFCGHGLQVDVPLLLPEDFAENKNNPWKNAIDFNGTYGGMRQCNAQTQYYVIDACRNRTKLMYPKSVEGVKLKQIDLEVKSPRTAPTLFATADGLPAFGDTGGTSRMTAALIRCLEGVGAERLSSGKWVVSTTSLGLSVQRLVNLANAELSTSDWQIVDPAILEHALGPRELHVLKPGRVPDVHVSLDCVPDNARPAALFFHQPLLGGQKVQATAAGPWTTTIPAGFYNIGVSFNPPHPQYKPTERMEFIFPPVWPITIEVV